MKWKHDTDYIIILIISIQCPTTLRHFKKIISECETKIYINIFEKFKLIKVYNLCIYVFKKGHVDKWYSVLPPWYNLYRIQV